VFYKAWAIASSLLFLPAFEARIIFNSIFCIIWMPFLYNFAIPFFQRKKLKKFYSKCLYQCWCDALTWGAKKHNGDLFWPYFPLWREKKMRRKKVIEQQLALKLFGFKAPLSIFKNGGTLTYLKMIIWDTSGEIKHVPKRRRKHPYLVAPLTLPRDSFVCYGTLVGKHCK